MPKKRSSVSPFRKFVIHLTNGANVPIDRDEDVAIHTARDEAVVFGKDAYIYINGNEIASIPCAAMSKGRGAPVRHGQKRKV